MALRPDEINQLLAVIREDNELDRRPHHSSPRPVFILAAGRVIECRLGYLHSQNVTGPQRMGIEQTTSTGQIINSRVRSKWPPPTSQACERERESVRVMASCSCHGALSRHPIPYHTMTSPRIQPHRQLFVVRGLQYYRGGHSGNGHNNLHFSFFLGNVYAYMLLRKNEKFW